MCGVHGRPAGGHGRRFRFGWTEPEAMPDFPGNGGSAVFPRPAAQPFRRFAFVPVVSLL